MISREQIKKDLKEIKNYYILKDLFKNVKSIYIPKQVEEKVNYYNLLMQRAPVRLQAIYAALYIGGKTQKAIAAELCVELNTVAKNNYSIVNFLAKEIDAGIYTNL